MTRKLTLGKMDAPGFEPGTFRMQSRRDTTTPTAYAGVEDDVRSALRKEVTELSARPGPRKKDHEFLPSPGSIFILRSSALRKELYATPGPRKKYLDFLPSPGSSFILRLSALWKEFSDRPGPD